MKIGFSYGIIVLGDIMKQKYYAVMDKDNKLIFTSWDEALEVIKKLKAPKYKSFQTKEEAQDFLSGIEYKEHLEPTAYIDGSYDVNTEKYSFGGVLILNGNLYKFNKAYPKDEFSSMRNVAGELKGAAYVMQYAIRHNIPRLHIYFDYIGIENWYNGVWRAKSRIAIEYSNYCNSIKDKIEIVFHKVKSHTNNYYNEMADKLAKEALGI